MSTDSTPEDPPVANESVETEVTETPIEGSTVSEVTESKVEPIIAESEEKSGSPHPETISSNANEPPKKLSLQERLALAAKSKKKKKASSSAPVQEKNEPISPVPAATPEPEDGILPSNWKQLSLEQLQELIPRLKEQFDSKTDSTWIKLVKEKEAVIEKLTKEGENLPKTELKQSTVIKKLRAQESSFNSSIEKLKDELAATKEMLVSSDSLCSELKSQLSDVNKQQSSLNKQSTQWEEEKSKLLEKQQELSAQVVQLQTELDEQLAEHQYELKEAREKHNSLKESSSAEIARLETKIEALRFELEETSDHTLALQNLRRQMVVQSEEWARKENEFTKQLEELHMESKTLEVQVTEKENSVEQLTLEKEQLVKKNIELKTELESERNLLAEAKSLLESNDKEHKESTAKLESRIQDLISLADNEEQMNTSVQQAYDELDNYSDIASRADSDNRGDQIKLVQNLSSQVRRLEIELQSSKNQTAKLVREKTSLNDEIMSLLNDTSAQSDLKSKLADLESQVALLERRERTALELLGEKSERVEELQADVEDLKDLCRQQVQQLADLYK